MPKKSSSDARATTEVVVGLVGDRSDKVVAHGAIPIALERAARESGVRLRYEWLPTEHAADDDRVAAFSGLWCVPGSPYRSTAGALAAIRHARESGTPFLGTCGGFQHAVLEYAQHVLGWDDASHAELTPSAQRSVIAALSCGLLEGEAVVRLRPKTRLAAAYGVSTTTAEYFCRYGVNPELRAALVAGPLREAATDDAGDLRAVELDAHPFFVATLFQPERAALHGRPVPLATAFVKACAAARRATEKRTRSES